MKRWILGLALLALIPPAKAEKLQVVTTIFPLYDWVREVGGEDVDAFQLLPPGVEAHGYAPRPSDLFRINRADMFLYLGASMEPWAEDLVKGLDNPNLLVVKASDGISLRPEEGAHNPGPGEKHDAGHEPHDFDPHIWLDPVLAQQIVTRIAAALAQKDPAHQAQYMARAGAYNERLQALDAKIRSALAGCRRKQILYGGHFAFGYFARRYGLTHESPYPGFSPNAEPSPRAVAELARKIKTEGLSIVYHEELIDPKVARVIAEETGAKLMLLHGAHNITEEERAQGATYLSIMEDNIERLKAGLE